MAAVVRTNVLQHRRQGGQESNEGAQRLTRTTEMRVHKAHPGIAPHWRASFPTVAHTGPNAFHTEPNLANPNHSSPDRVDLAPSRVKSFDFGRNHPDSHEQWHPPHRAVASGMRLPCLCGRCATGNMASACRKPAAADSLAGLLSFDLEPAHTDGDPVVGLAAGLFQVLSTTAFCCTRWSAFRKPLPCQSRPANYNTGRRARRRLGPSGRCTR